MTEKTGGLSRRNLILSGSVVSAGLLMTGSASAEIAATPKSALARTQVGDVVVQGVEFKKNDGIMLSGNIYYPKGFNEGQKYAAIVVVLVRGDNPDPPECEKDVREGPSRGLMGTVPPPVTCASVEPAVRFELTTYRLQGRSKRFDQDEARILGPKSVKLLERYVSHRQVKAQRLAV